jgi:WD40 repeat protein
MSIREESHRALSEYFACQQLFVEAEGRHSANLRKLTEWPFQLWGAKDWPKLSQTLSDFRFLNAKVSALGTEAVIEDFDLLEDADDDVSSDVDYDSLRILQACLRLTAGVLSEDAGQLPAQLHGRLAARQSPLLRNLLKEAIVQTSKPWLRPLSASLVSTGGALLANYAFDRNVEVVAISSDVTHLLVGCDDGSVRIGNIEDGKEIHRLQPHTEQIIAIKPVPGRQCFVSGSRDGHLAVWDDQGKIHTRQRASVRRLFDLDVLADGNVLVAGGEVEPDEHGYHRGVILILSLGDAMEKGRLQVHPGSVTFIAISPCGHILLCGTSHGSIQKWDLDDLQLLAETSLHDGGAIKATFLPDGRRALICSGDQSTGQYNLRFWDVHSWEELHVFRHHRYMLTDVAVSQTGDRALSASYDQTLCLWNLERYRLIARLTGHRHPVRSVVLEPKGGIAYSASGTSVYRWSLDRAALTDNTQRHSDPVHIVAATRDGQLGVSAAGDGCIAVWQLSGPRPVLAHRINNCDAR